MSDGPKPATVATKREGPLPRPRPAPEQPPVPTLERRRFPIAGVIAVVAIAGIVAVIAYVLGSRDAAPEETATAEPPEMATAGPPETAYLLAHAREAERAEQLEVAIASYLTAYATTRDPELLYRAAELHERRAHGLDAAMLYRRYLDRVPKPIDRAEIEWRIERLTDPHAVRDAGVPDAAPPSIPDAPAPTKACYCQADASRFQQLCKRPLSPNICRCVTSEEALCPSRFVYCVDKRCATTHYAITTSRDQFSCPVAWINFHTPATPGAPCRGYKTADLDSPSAAETAPVRTGHYECSACEQLELPLAEYRAQFRWTAPEGSRCTGYLTTDRRESGHVVCVEEP